MQRWATTVLLLCVVTGGIAENLGVVKIDLHAILPKTYTGQTQATVHLYVWLTRVKGTAVPFTLPHQQRDVVRGFAWAEDDSHLHSRGYGHIAMNVGHFDWEPQLYLETPASPTPIRAKVHMGDHKYDIPPVGRIRPYSFLFELPDSPTDCFRIMESSYAGHKVDVCLPEAPAVCSSLANPEQYTDRNPALWTVMSPIRQPVSSIPPSQWGEFYKGVAGRLSNYLKYHIAMGTNGVLLYDGALAKSMLSQSPELVEYVRAGQLRFVDWDMGEKIHGDDGKGITLLYCYDQALIASHALLATSPCGSNLMAMVSDIDEYLYMPTGGRWPSAVHGCMLPQASTAGVFTIQRHDVHSTNIMALQEPALWAGTYDNVSVSKELFTHPLACYNYLTKKPIFHAHSKTLVYPAAYVIDFFVHEGFPLHGSKDTMDTGCITLLHVRNMFHSRHIEFRPDEYVPFNPWFMGSDKCTFNFGNAVNAAAAG